MQRRTKCNFPLPKFLDPKKLAFYQEMQYIWKQIKTEISNLRSRRVIVTGEQRKASNTMKEQKLEGS